LVNQATGVKYVKLFVIKTARITWSWNVAHNEASRLIEVSIYVSLISVRICSITWMIKTKLEANAGNISFCLLRNIQFDKNFER